MNTIHNFIDKYPISPTSQKLILGTIHPHNVSAFRLPFFYGNKISLWKILSKAFPDELASPITLEGILQFLNNREISISDTILECKRASNSALDSDLIPVRLNKTLKAQLLNSKIVEIYFTSGFGKNNAFKLFYEDILNLKIDEKIKSKKEIRLPESLFGREIICKILISPSGAANISLSKSKSYMENKAKYVKSKTPVQDYKIDCYKNIFQIK